MFNNWDDQLRGATHGFRHQMGELFHPGNLGNLFGGGIQFNVTIDGSQLAGTGTRSRRDEQHPSIFMQPLQAAHSARSPEAAAVESARVQQQWSEAGLTTVYGDTRVNLSMQDIEQRRRDGLTLPEIAAEAQVMAVAHAQQDAREAQAAPAAARGGDPNVRRVQEWLNANGFEAGPNDGHQGPLTMEGLKNFREQAGLEIDPSEGITSADVEMIQAWEQARAEGREPPRANADEPTQPAATPRDNFQSARYGDGMGRAGGSADVEALQTYLNTIGINAGTVDGDFGPITLAAAERLNQLTTAMGHGFNPQEISRADWNFFVENQDQITTLVSGTREATQGRDLPRGSGREVREDSLPTPVTAMLDTDTGRSIG